MNKVSEKAERALKRWRFLAIGWPVLCIIFSGIILYQAIGGMEERAFDIAFVLLSLIFFAIGMAMRRRLLKERRYATTRTTATVISTGRKGIEKKHYFPEYEFRKDGQACRIRGTVGYSSCPLEEHSQVELYYNPDNPQLFYVPLMQKHDSRWAALLCTVGIVYPLLGLFAPYLRTLFAFLESRT